MPFRLRQSMPTYSVGKISFQYPEIDSETQVSRMVEHPQQVALPDSKMTDLDLQLKAGVPLQKVNCEVLAPTGLDKVLNAPEEQVKDGE